MASRWVALLLLSAAPAFAWTDTVFEGGAITVRGRRLPPQVSERVLSGEEARSMPGAGGDVIRALAALPGAVTPNDYLANLLVRGGGFDDNLVLLDSVPAAYPFHFGGLESVFHPGLIREAVFLPGAFDARFGDTLGGVLDLRTARSPAGTHGEVGVSAIQASGLLSYSGESDGWQSAGAWRRGWFDLVLNSDASFVGVPRWQDYHLHQRGPLLGGEARWSAFGSQDSLSAKGGPGTRDSTFDSSFDAFGAGFSSQAGPWRIDLRGSGSLGRMKVDLGPDLALERKPYAFAVAAEADALLAADHAVNAGLQWQQTNTILEGAFARLPVELGTGLDFYALTRTAVSALGRKGVSSAWAQDRWQLTDRAAMSLGARFDQVDISSEYHFSPRWSLEVQAWESGTLRAAVGDYFQSPNALETVPGWTRGLARSALVRSYTVGLQQKLGGSELRLEAYRKDFERRLPEISVPASNVVINSANTGWAEGAEAMLRFPKLWRFSGWLSYALSDVQRSSGTGGFYDADFSQPHVGNLVLEADLGWGLTFGGHWRQATGIPYTPVASRSFDAGSGRWVPVFGATNSRRLDDYRRLDLRLEKRWSALVDQWWTRISVFVEAFNALDAVNITSVTYEDDYSDIRCIRQFPRLFYGGVDLAF